MVLLDTDMEDSMTEKPDYTPDPAARGKGLRKLKSAKADRRKARAEGIDRRIRKYEISKDKIVYDDRDMWRDAVVAMVDGFNRDDTKTISNYKAVLMTMEANRAKKIVYREGYEKYVDDYDPLLRIVAFVIGIASITEDDVLSDDDMRRVLGQINSVRTSLVQLREGSEEQKKQARAKRHRESMQRTSVREAARYAVDNNIDPYELGSFTDPKVIDTLAEMYRLSVMHRKRSDGQRERTTKNMHLLRSKYKSLIRTHHTLLTKTKGEAAANAWRTAYLAKNRFNETHKKDEES